MVRADGEHYGHLLVYRFPKQRVVWGPKQVIGLINQDAEISRQLTLWNQRAHRSIWNTPRRTDRGGPGLRAAALSAPESGRYLELKRVIVVVQDRPIAMEETLEASLSRVFGGKRRAGSDGRDGDEGELTTPVEGLAAQANEHFEKASAGATRWRLGAIW
jgi:uncharacterized membrane protein (UPF0182 family)